MCCLLAPWFDPSCTPYLHALTLKELPKTKVSLPFSVIVSRVTMSHPPGLLAECPGLCGQRPRCLSCRPMNGFVLSVPPTITCGRVYSKWCIHYMKSLWVNFKVCFEGTVSNFRITEGKQIFHKQMKECFVHHMDLSFGIDFVPYILNILSGA